MLVSRARIKKNVRVASTAGKTLIRLLLSLVCTVCLVAVKAVWLAITSVQNFRIFTTQCKKKLKCNKSALKFKNKFI